MKKPMIYLGADHAGFELKEAVKVYLAKKGYVVHDVSPDFKKGDDYPERAFEVAKQVSMEPESRGVIVCGSGVGVTIAANRISGVRAFNARDTQETKLAREHNDVNVIALSGWHMKPVAANKLIETFLTAKASSAERHRRRVAQLK
jgi:ribose 5-phosphate isomerase B